MPMRTVVLRVVALAMLLLLAIVTGLTVRTLNRLPNSIVYFIKDEGTGFRLEPAGRKIKTTDDTARLGALLEHLVTGPNSSEKAKGLSTAFPENLEVYKVLLNDGTVTVDVSYDFEYGGLASIQGRLNQLFYTLTQANNVEQIVLELNGFQTDVISGEGLIIDNPWRREDHTTLPVW